MRISPGTSYVVDTNVAVVANGGEDAQGDARCQLQCVEALQRVVDCGVVVVDEIGLIFNEYMGRLSLGGTAVGDRFLKHVFDHMWGGEKARRVAITRSDDDRRGFEELPPNNFDPSDRKFLATAVAGNAEVLNATDSDWSQHQVLTERLGVPVQQLCPWLGSKPAGKR